MSFRDGKQKPRSGQRTVILAAAVCAAGLDDFEASAGALDKRTWFLVRALLALRLEALF